jgi:hypothetical protein
VLRQDKEFALEVVDLAKDPLAAGPLARSTTRNLIFDKALVAAFMKTCGQKVFRGVIANC